MKRKPNYLRNCLGPITDPRDGTDADCIGSMVLVLRRALRTCRIGRENRKRYVRLIREFEASHENGTAECDCMIDDYLIALDELAPPHTRVEERDGVYGIWPDITPGEGNGGDLPRLDAHEYPEGWALEHQHFDDALIVNDHGNVSCGRFDKRGQWHEYWSVA